MMNLSDTCSLCKKPSVLACSRCTEAYCSPQCQTKDWIRHRHFCLPMPPLVYRSDLQQVYSEIANASGTSDSELAEMVAFSQEVQSVEKAPKKADVPKARVAIPPAPLKDAGLFQKRAAVVLAESDKKAEMNANNWKVKPDLASVARKEVEVVIHHYDQSTREGWLVLARDKQACNAMMSELNKAKDLQPATADAVRVGQLYAIQYTEKVLARGEIKAATNGSYKVHMIDYGETIMVGIEKLLLPIPSILTRKAFAFHVRFNDNRERFQHQRLIINFLGSLEDKVQLVETFDMPFTPVVEILLESNIEAFDANVVSILGKNWFIVQTKMSKELVLKKEDMADISRFEVTDTVKKGLMIVVDEPEQPKRRGLVLEIDQKLGMCVVFLCDIGTIKCVVVPKKARLVPYYLAVLPAQTVFVEIKKVVTQNEADFLHAFCQAGTSFKFEMVKGVEGSVSYDAKIKLGDTVVANAKVFNSEPNLKSYGLNIWTMYSAPKTPVKVLKAHVTDQIQVVIHPSLSLLYAKKILENFKGENITAPPSMNDVVVFTLQTQGNIRCIVTNVVKSTVQMTDLDSGATYTTEFTALKKATKLLQNIPVYKMVAPLKDYPVVNPDELPLVCDFFELGHLKRRELVLAYDGHPYYGVQLHLGYGADSIVTKLKEFMDVKKKEFADKIALEEKHRLEALEAEARARQEAREKQEKAEAEARERQAKAEAEARAKEEKAKLQVKVSTPEPQASPGSAEISKLEALKAAIREEEERLRKEAEAKVTPSLPNGILFDDMQVMMLPEGKTYDILILDVMPEKGLMAVCEYNIANLQFAGEILTAVSDHVATVDVEVKKGYKPSVREMCLALYDADGSWYRAVCVERPTAGEFRLNMIDFGTIIVVTADKIMAFPEALMKPAPRTHLAKIKGWNNEQIAALEPYSSKKFKVESCEDGFYQLTPA